MNGLLEQFSSGQAKQFLGKNNHRELLITRKDILLSPIPGFTRLTDIFVFSFARRYEPENCISVKLRCYFIFILIMKTQMQSWSFQFLLFYIFQFFWVPQSDRSVMCLCAKFRFKSQYHKVVFLINRGV